jgi:hypothetical protein
MDDERFCGFRKHKCGQDRNRENVKGMKTLTLEISTCGM